MKCEEFPGMLDAFVDGELGSEARVGILQHARECENCASELRRAETLKKMLFGLDDGVKVPLAAQAAWRGAIKAEARKKKVRVLYRALGTIAAACVVLVGVMAGVEQLRDKPTYELPAAKVVADSSELSTFAFVAPDGDEDLSTMQAMPRTFVAAEMASTVRISADDVTKAVETVKNLVDEFNGSIGDSSFSAATAYMTVSIPAGEYAAFTESLSFAGAVEASDSGGESGDMVSVTITIQGN